MQLLYDLKLIVRIRDNNFQEDIHYLMKARFLCYRGGLRTQQNNQILVKINSVNDRNIAAKYIGKKIEWKSSKGKTLIGKIVGLHGRKGVLKARFRKGLPGEAIGTELIIR
jgi:large subunit ribosomal protein L35Ae